MINKQLIAEHLDKLDELIDEIYCEVDWIVSDEICEECFDYIRKIREELELNE